MKLNTNSILSFFLFFCFSVFPIVGQVEFKKTSSFYPDIEMLKNEEIVWGNLFVPENWENSKGSQISLAIAILKKTSKKSSNNALIYIPGGPGGDGISSIFFWLNHPLRVENDIVLIDLRGTGFSKPRLCPDLGKDFLKILAKNQSEIEDEKQKIIAAISCKNQLLIAGVDPANYNSKSIAKDLNSLKTELGYLKWHVYGVSYGTFMAQVYTNEYANDIKSLLLDSSISNIEKYYTENTSGYMASLFTVFNSCKNNPQCNIKYPNLEKIYYQTINNLQEKPLTVDVDPDVLDSGSFTYNVQDFKVALQQALYHKNLIELVPMLLYEFFNGNKQVLGSLVAAFSGALEMDYGVYYSISCNEVLPFNDFSEYESDAAKYKELKGGVSFYKSDFNVCRTWNESIKDSLKVSFDSSNLKKLDIPVLIFAGGFDPITPPSNGKEMLQIFKEGYLINAPNYGHVPGFTDIGSQIALEFVQDPTVKPKNKNFMNEDNTTFIQDIKMNAGIVNLGSSLTELNLFFLAPLIIALGITFSFIFVHLFNLFRKKYIVISDRIIRVLSIFTSLAGIVSLIGLIVAISQVAQQNFYILVFGLPDSYGYLLKGALVFIVFLSISILYFLLSFRKIKNRSVLFSIIFSNILLAAYLFYWQIL